MNLLKYLSSKVITLCFLIIGGIIFGTAAAFAEISVQLIFLSEGFYLLIILLWLTISFLFARRKTKKINKIIKELPEKYLLGEVLPPPTNVIEQWYYSVIKEISRSAIGIVEQVKREKEEYCDYVERWIHEVKTPLTACWLILENSGDVKKLKSELKRADNLTESILYYARMRSAEKDTQIKKFNVAETINEAVKNQMELLIAANICVETQGDFEIYSDNKVLCFIIKQMLINCAKYCPECLVRITAHAGTITIEDNGVGIPSYELSRVTERGFTGECGRKLGSSTGMGLYIARELCEKLDLDMKIESIIGEFTKITLTYRNLTKL